MSSPTLGSPAETLVDGLPKQLSSTRKFVLLSIFCFAQLLNIFNVSAIFPVMPILERSMDITESQSPWIVSAIQLTFASFLLISGRISDIYNPKTTFVTGLFLLGTLSIGTGFVNNKIVIIVLRALIGIASAMIIPSMLTLLVYVFPEPLEQARALAVLAGCCPVGNVLGLLIGAVLVQYTSFHWVFWFVTMASIPLGLASLFIIPLEVGKPGSCSAKWKSLDLIGISILTSALVLFIYSVTSGPANGWATAGVLAPLITSMLLVVGFFHWETLVPAERAAIPHRTWFYNNFCVLIGSALLPFFWWSAISVVFTALWRDVFHWTVVSTAVHRKVLPCGVAALLMSLTGPLSRLISPKWIIITGHSMVALATMLLAMGGGRPEDYWPYIFPAFCLGGAGVMLVGAHTNIALFRATPASMAGTVGAIFNAALQLGSAVGLAVFISIETSVEAIHGGFQGYSGRAAAFWFLLGIVLVEILSVLYFYQRASDHGPEPKPDYTATNAVKEKPNQVEKV